LFCIDGLHYSSAGVTTLKRDGGQSQFSDLLETQFLEDSVLSGLIAAIFATPGHRWTLEEMSKVANLTPRTLTRRFDKLFAISPSKFLERARTKFAADALSGERFSTNAEGIQKTSWNDRRCLSPAFRCEVIVLQVETWQAATLIAGCGIDH